MSEILVSTGALIGRPNGRDYRLLERLKAEINSDGFEFMMYSDWYDKVDDIIEFAAAIGLNTPTYHCQKSIGEGISKGGDDYDDGIRRFKINAKMASRMGANKLILHLWDGITSDSNFANNIKAYPYLLDIAKEEGLDLLVENVVCNVKDPLYHWIELKGLFPDIHYIFDTKMAAFHGQLEMLYDKEYKWLYEDNHIRHYHVNDYAGGLMDWANLKTLPIGSGKIDFDKFFDFINKIGYSDTFTLESTAFDSTGSVDTDMLNRQISYMKNRLN